MNPWDILALPIAILLWILVILGLIGLGIIFLMILKILKD